MPVLGDVTTEGTETFQVNLSSPVNGVIGDAQGIGTIYDNDGLPSLVVTDASAMESDGQVSFSVLLPNATVTPVTVDYVTADGSAVAGSDYTAKNNTLTFSPLEVSKTVNVSITADVLDEDDETFTLNLSNASGASVADAQGVGTIFDDDAEPNISIGNATVVEGDSGTVIASFSVTLAPVSGREVNVDYATSDGTATAGSDYETSNGTLVFAAGETTKQIAGAVYADVVAESGETFTVDLPSPRTRTS